MTEEEEEVGRRSLEGEELTTRHVPAEEDDLWMESH